MSSERGCEVCGWNLCCAGENPTEISHTRGTHIQRICPGPELVLLRKLAKEASDYVEKAKRGPMAVIWPLDKRITQWRELETEE